MFTPSPTVTAWRSLTRRWHKFMQRKSQPFWAGLGASAVLLTSALLSTSSQAQTPAKSGKELFEKRCGGCHALDRDKEGPRLGGVYGRTAASVSTFLYS